MNHAPRGARAPSPAAPPPREPAIRRDPRSQRALIDALSPVIRQSVAGRIRRRSRSSRSAEQEIDDVVQTILASLFAEEGGALDAWDPDRGLGLASFVSLIAARNVDSMLRSRRQNPWTEEPVEAEALDQVAARRPGVETLTSSRRLLSTIAARVRARTSPFGATLFDMVFLEQQPPEDVAATLGISVQAVYAWKSRLSRTARMIQGEIEGERSPSRRPRARGAR